MNCWHFNRTGIIIVSIYSVLLYLKYLCHSLITTKNKMLKVAFDKTFNYAVPKGHRFPMEKYELVPEQLLYEGTLHPENFFSPARVDKNILLLTHHEDYINKLDRLDLNAKEIRKMGLPLSSALIEREYRITQGTIDCALHAINYGIAMNSSGGTHHAYANRAEGFCLINDIAVAANYLLQEKIASNILIIDLDVHQGNGTAKIFENESRVFTLSVHGENNYPLHKEKSDLDIGLKDATSDKEYLDTIKNIIPNLIEERKPEFIFYLSGVDILATDKLGKISVSIEGCKERDQLVIKNCHQKNIPICISMGGGYSPQIKDIVEAHCNTFRIAQDIYF